MDQWTSRIFPFLEIVLILILILILVFQFETIMKIKRKSVVHWSTFGKWYSSISLCDSSSILKRIRYESMRIADKVYAIVPARLWRSVTLGEISKNVPQVFRNHIATFFIIFIIIIPLTRLSEAPTSL